MKYFGMDDMAALAKSEKMQSRFAGGFIVFLAVWIVFHAGMDLLRSESMMTGGLSGSIILVSLIIATMLGVIKNQGRRIDLLERTLSEDRGTGARVKAA